MNELEKTITDLKKYYSHNELHIYENFILDYKLPFCKSMSWLKDRTYANKALGGEYVPTINDYIELYKEERGIQNE